MGLSPEEKGSWEMLFLGLSWIRPSDLETLGGSDRSCVFQMFAFLLGMVSKAPPSEGPLVPLTLEDPEDSLNLLPFSDLYF